MRYKRQLLVFLLVPSTLIMTTLSFPAGFLLCRKSKEYKSQSIHSINQEEIIKKLELIDFENILNLSSDYDYDLYKDNNNDKVNMSLYDFELSESFNIELLNNNSETKENPVFRIRD